MNLTHDAILVLCAATGSALITHLIAIRYRSIEKKMPKSDRGFVEMCESCKKRVGEPCNIGVFCEKCRGDVTYP